MTSESRGRELFIVDNSVEGWTGLRYLQDWTEFATSFDIATGYFDIGSLLALDGKWQQLDKIRILMGAEMMPATKALLLKAVEERAKAKLDESLEATKDKNPFLTGVPAILAALTSGQIECRVYDKAKFHAKAYITHARSAVIGSQALVGSSNFTRPGLTNNVELNVQIQSSREVAQLQEWFESYWQQASDVTASIAMTVERHTRLYSPFDVYAKALQEFFRGHELTATEWDETQSKMYPHLDRYQKEAYWALMKIARQYGGAFLCDGVGLGKTFVGLMIIERMVMHEGKRVVLFAPKATKEGVWDGHIKEWLPHISSDFSPLLKFAHTDLGRTGENLPERFLDIAGQADVVIIDEAHHFRNPGRKGDDGKGEPSRYYRMFDLIDPEKRPKQVFMLTATPINNRLSDFRHMVELFTRRDEQYFARTVGVNNLRAHFNQLEKNLQAIVGKDISETTEDLSAAEDLLAADQLFRDLVVQRSRAYAVASQKKEKGEAAVFPERKPPQVAEYSIKKTYGKLLDDFETAFDRDDPLFRLAMYYPLRWYKGPDTTIDPLVQGRQRQVVTLIRLQFLKRFESSVVAFESSCLRMLKRMLAFIEIHSETESEKARLARWKRQHETLLSTTEARQTELWGATESDPGEEQEEDFVPPELIASIEWLDRAEYDVEEMLAETYLDLDEITKFVTETRKFTPKQDDKLQKLIRLLQSKDLAGEKVLIFSEFADTARYLHTQLKAAGIDGVEQVDSATKKNRADVIRAFAPYYNRSSSAELKARRRTEIRVLISTDVLSEGLNLQDATKMINYDIHWNPVRLMQRIGRVDRRMDPAVEERLKADHPEVASSRGVVRYWNFLPPDELTAIYSLYERVTQKVLLISKTLGIEGKKLLTPEDDWDALKLFNSQYEGTKTAIEDMHLELQALIQADPDLEVRLAQLPSSLFSGRERPAKGTVGVFFCYALPALDKERGEFTLEAGSTRWYLYDISSEKILEDPGEIVMSIRSDMATPRRCVTSEKTLVEIRAAIQKHIKDSYLKRVDAPLGVRPLLRCWMELNGS